MEILALIFLLFISAWLAAAIIESILLTGTLNRRDILLLTCGAMPTLYGWYLLFESILIEGK